MSSLFPTRCEFVNTPVDRNRARGSGTTTHGCGSQSTRPTSRWILLQISECTFRAFHIKKSITTCSSALQQANLKAALLQKCAHGCYSGARTNHDDRSLEAETATKVRIPNPRAKLRRYQHERTSVSLGNLNVDGCTNTSTRLLRRSVWGTERAAQ